MPPSSRSLTGTRLSRRAVLGATAAVTAGALVGCTSDEDRPRRVTEPAPVEPSVDPDVEVAAEALADQQAMLDLLAATRERHRGLGELLAPVVAAHEAHVAMLSDAVPDKGAASPSPSPEGTSRRSTRVPRNSRKAVENVVTAEQELTTTAKRHAFRAQSGAFARLLGSMAAASAQYATVLGSAPSTGKEAS